MHNLQDTITHFPPTKNVSFISDSIQQLPIADWQKLGRDWWFDSLLLCTVDPSDAWSLAMTYRAPSEIRIFQRKPMVDKDCQYGLSSVLAGGRLTSHNTIATKLRKSCLAEKKQCPFHFARVSAESQFLSTQRRVYRVSHTPVDDFASGNVSQVVVHRYQPPHCSWTWHSFFLKSDHSLPKKSIAFQSSFLKETVVVFFPPRVVYITLSWEGKSLLKKLYA